MSKIGQAMRRFIQKLPKFVYLVEVLEPPMSAFDLQSIAIALPHNADSAYQHHVKKVIDAAYEQVSIVNKGHSFHGLSFTTKSEDKTDYAMGITVKPHRDATPSQILESIEDLYRIMRSTNKAYAISIQFPDDTIGHLAGITAEERPVVLAVLTERLAAAQKASLSARKGPDVAPKATQ